MKLTTAIIPLFFFFHSYAQITIRNESLLKPDTNIMVQQVGNRLKVFGTDQKVHMVSGNGAGITAYDGNTFVIVPKNLMPDTLSLFAGNKLLLRKTFTIDTLPELSIQLGNIQSDTATIKEIIANKVLIAVFKGSLYNNPIRVTGFTTTFTGPNGEMQDSFMTVQANTLSDEQIAIIKQLKKNSKILFDNIHAVTTDGRTRRLSPFDITIR